MSIIEKFKNSVFQNNLFKSIIDIPNWTKFISDRGLFLAAAPVIAFFLLLISSIFGGLIEKKIILVINIITLCY